MSPPPDMSHARGQTLALLDLGRPEKALRAAQQLPAEDPNAVQVLAFAEIEGGEQLGDPDFLRRGVDRLARLEERVGVSMAYNRANGHFALWTLAARHDGVARAHAEHRADLHAAPGRVRDRRRRRVPRRASRHVLVAVTGQARQTLQT